MSAIKQNTDIEDLHPHCPFFGSQTAKLDPLKLYKYCTCGLSDTFECNNKCLGTGFKPIEFYPKNTVVNTICLCRYSKSLPYCDASHTSIPVEYIKRQQECKLNHKVRLCSNCGFANKTLE